MAKYRSKFEKRIAATLRQQKVKFNYESKKIPYKVKVISNPCSKCGNPDIYVSRNYIPDFLFRDDKIILELKGVLDRAERKKFKAIKESNPTLDIRLLFQRNNRIYRGSETYYSDWATAEGFPFAFETIPINWIKEFKNGN